MKNDHRLDRNYLKGKRGDQINVVLAACGYNLRTIYRRIASIFFVLYGFIQNLPKNIKFMDDLPIKLAKHRKPKLILA